MRRVCLWATLWGCALGSTAWASDPMLWSDGGYAGAYGAAYPGAYGTAYPGAYGAAYPGAYGTCSSCNAAGGGCYGTGCCDRPWSPYHHAWDGYCENKCRAWGVHWAGPAGPLFMKEVDCCNAQYGGLGQGRCGAGGCAAGCQDGCNAGCASGGCQQPYAWQQSPHRRVPCNSSGCAEPLPGTSYSAGHEISADATTVGPYPQAAGDAPVPSTRLRPALEENNAPTSDAPLPPDLQLTPMVPTPAPPKPAPLPTAPKILETAPSSETNAAPGPATDLEVQPQFDIDTSDPSVQRRPGPALRVAPAKSGIRRAS